MDCNDYDENEELMEDLGSKDVVDQIVSEIVDKNKCDKKFQNKTLKKHNKNKHKSNNLYCHICHDFF